MWIMVEEPTPLAVELSVDAITIGDCYWDERAELMLTATPTATITIRSDSTGIARL